MYAIIYKYEHVIIILLLIYCVNLLSERVIYLSHEDDQQIIKIN